MIVSRRALVAGVASGLLARRARADVDPQWRPRGLDLRELDATGTGRRVVLAVPRDLAAGRRVPLVVLLHGLGETGNPRDGAWAWLERYGLGTSYDRMREAGSGAELAFVCPSMPLLAGASDLEGYARWIGETVLPRARAEAPVLATQAATVLGGCSLGGRVSLEVFLRAPEVFGAWAGVQTAIDAGAAARFAERLASAVGRVGTRDLFLETSSGDPFRSANAVLGDALTARGVAHRFVELPGPHDQPWLRRSGTPALLAWLATRP